MDKRYVGGRLSSQQKLMIPPKERLQNKLDTQILSIDFYTKGQIGDIYKVKTANNTYILKTSEPSDNLQIEASMIKDVHKYHIPVPQVYDVSESYLLSEYIPTQKIAKCTQEIEAAKILSQLHAVSNDTRMYGYYYDTTIGPFRQKNEQTQYNWSLFLSQMRIMPMSKICYDKGAITKDMLTRIEILCRDIYKRIDMTTITPSLLHGDLWSDNILFNINGATLIDPALYFGDREMDLAYIMMLDTFDDTFFNAYTEVHPLSEEFYEVKVLLYQIYPLLVHVALYGDGYATQLEQTLKRLKV